MAAASASPSEPAPLSVAVAAPVATSPAVPPLTRALCSGAVAGVVADATLHPIETINTRIKVQQRPSADYATLLRSARTILRNEGLRGCYGGLSTTILSAPISAALYFGAYESIKALALPHVSDRQASGVYLVAGACSEVAVSAISVPAEVIKVQLQLGRNPHRASSGAIARTVNYRGTFDAMRAILRQQGVRGLYAGYTACLSVDTTFSAFSFFFYETLKQQWQVHKYPGHPEHPLSSAESLVLGSLAGGGAAFLSNPMDIMTVRLMAQGGKKQYAGLANCLYQSVKKDGVLSLWRGATCRMSSVMPNMGICFGVYETIKRYVFRGDMESFDWEER